MAIFFVEVDGLDNAAFADNDNTDLELGRILRGLAQRVEEGDRSGVLRDANGRVVGRFRMES
jgi:hypothetical protein